jgi:hypothetical protein
VRLPLSPKRTADPPIPSNCGEFPALTDQVEGVRRIVMSVSLIAGFAWNSGCAAELTPQIIVGKGFSD